jgi:hypothetical protein
LKLLRFVSQIIAVADALHATGDDEMPGNHVE